MNKLSLVLLLGSLVLSEVKVMAMVTDFTPIKAMATGDGPAQPITMFRRGEGYVALRVPLAWTPKKQGAGVQFTSNDFAQASIYLAPVTKAVPFSDPEKAVAVHRELLLETVPKDAIDVVVSAEPRADGKLQLWPLYTAEVSFNYYGNKFRRTVLVLDQQSAGQLQVIITAASSNYDETNQFARSLLRTWWNVTPRDLSDIQIQ